MRRYSRRIFILVCIHLAGDSINFYSKLIKWKMVTKILGIEVQALDAKVTM